jgi:pimeloyl-ACP methyl ester carboxylesterase
MVIADLEKYSRFTDVKGVRTHYCDAGKGDPLVLLHGGGAGGGYSVVWRHNIAELAKDFRVIGIDRVGYGLTDVPPDSDYSENEAAEYTIALLEKLGIESPYICGQSTGGYIACYVQLTRKMAKKLILVNTKSAWMLGDGIDYQSPKEYGYENFGPPTIESLKRLRLHPTLVPPEHAGVYTQEMWDTILEQAKRNYEPFMKPRKLRRARHKSGGESSVRNMKMIGGKHITELYPQIDVPTLILWGSRDIIPGEKILWAYNSLKKAQMHAFCDAGHYLFQTHSEQFNKIVKVFCKEAFE